MLQAREGKVDLSRAQRAKCTDNARNAVTAAIESPMNRRSQCPTITSTQHTLRIHSGCESPRGEWEEVVGSDILMSDVLRARRARFPAN